MMRFKLAARPAVFLRPSCCLSLPATADIKIGVIYDHTGAFAAGGSKAAAIGNKIAIDMINEKGGVAGHKIVCDRGRRAVQDRRRHQRGGAAAERRQGRPADGRLLQRALRADGRPGGRGQEVHVGQRVRGLGGLQGQEPAVRVPPAGAFRPVRRGVLLVRRRERQVQAQEGSEGRQGRHHPRGRPLRRRRRHGQRGQVQGARHPGRAQGGLRRHLARSLRARHQAAAGPGRCDPAHRLQPRHHAVPAPVQGGGPEVVGPDRPRRRLRADRQADRDLQGRRQLRLQRRSGGGPAARPQDPRSRAWAI